MEVVSRGRTGHLIARVIVLGWLAGLLPASASADPPSVLGTWHVVVQYAEDGASGPRLWDHRIWAFERTGTRLRWTQYPTVVFEDPAGLEGDMGQGARAFEIAESLESWIAEIEIGLSANRRGAKSNTLKPTDGYWASFSESSVASTSVINYLEYWSVSEGDSGPIFRQDDALVGERVQNLAGVTLYTTREIGEGGNSLFGTFERDGTERGTFRMTRIAQTGDPQRREDAMAK